MVEDPTPEPVAVESQAAVVEDVVTETMETQEARHLLPVKVRGATALSN